MNDADLYDEDALAGEDALDELDGDGLDDADELDDMDELDASDDMDELDSGDDMDELDDLDQGDDLDEGDGLDDLDEGYDEGDELVARHGGIASRTGAARVLRAPANRAVLQAMDAEDADEFLRRLRRVGRLARGAVRTVGRVARGPLGQIAGRILQVAPLPPHLRALGQAGLALARGEGLRGAARAGLRGLLPGRLGAIAGRVLRGDGADDDDALDALADLADAGEVDAFTATPVGAGLAAHGAARRAVGPTRNPTVRRGARQAQQIFLRAAASIRGTTGQRLRMMQAMGRLTEQILRQQTPSRRQRARQLPQAAQRAARVVQRQVQQRPTAGRTPPTQAQRRLQQRRTARRRACTH